MPVGPDRSERDGVSRPKECSRSAPPQQQQQLALAGPDRTERALAKEREG